MTAPAGERDVARGEYVISSDRARLPVADVHRWPCDESYWARGIPRAVVQTAVQNSLNFGLYHGADLVGFARVVTDYATFAYVGDVFVLPAHRGRGLSKWLMATIAADPRLSGFRRWILATRDAHGLYAQAGYAALAQPDRWMEMRPVKGYVEGAPDPLAAPTPAAPTAAPQGSAPPPR